LIRFQESIGKNNRRDEWYGLKMAVCEIPGKEIFSRNVHLLKGTE
jgi:hypothetical protein